MNDFGIYYQDRCASASEEQGIDLLVKELALLGISSESAQTGGFTMCAYIVLKGDRYIYANSYGAGLYDGEDGFIDDIYLNESEGDDLARTKDVVRGVAQWIKENK
jgi:hypothetical protein